MDAQLKEKWIETLRSGAYKQTRNKLLAPTGSYEGEAYCCIGVGYIACTGPIPFGDDTSLASEALGLSDDEMEHLIELNDKQKKSFPEIADYIEQNL